MKYCLALDLVNDEKSIAAYEKWHRAVWPAVIASIRDSGITGMEIYRFSNRLFMIMDTTPAFSFEKKSESDGSNPEVQQWERLMDEFQQLIPGTDPDSKWMLMNKIFDLND